MWHLLSNGVPIYSHYDWWQVKMMWLQFYLDWPLVTIEYYDEDCHYCSTITDRAYTESVYLPHIAGR